MKSLLASQTRQFIINILIIVVSIVLLWLMYFLGNIIVIFLISCFFALLLGPFVAKLQQWHFPNILAILVTFSVVILAGIIFIISLIPVFADLFNNSKTYIIRSITAIEQQAQMGFPVVNALPFGLDTIVRSKVDIGYVSQLITSENRTKIVMDEALANIDTVQRFFQRGAGQISNIGFSFASSISSVLGTLVLGIMFTFFILLERRIFLRWFFTILPDHLGHYFHSRQHIISQAIHTWLRGQLLLAFWMFVLNIVGLSIAQLFGLPINHIFSLALLAGVMEFVPYLGPIIAFVPAFLMVLVSPEMTLWSLVGVSVLYIIFQQIESNFLYTYIMSQTLRLPALYILVVTLIGATLGGALGIVFAMPFAAIIHIFYHDWMHYRRVIQKEK